MLRVQSESLPEPARNRLIKNRQTKLSKIEAGDRVAVGTTVPDRLDDHFPPEHRVGLEPTLPHYESGVFATRRPVPMISTG